MHRHYRTPWFVLMWLWPRLVVLGTLLLAGQASAEHKSGGYPCGPDPAPTQAAAVGFTCETFSDGNPWSLSTIDINNTGGLGFKWYVNMSWPRAADSSWQVNGINSPGDFSVSGGNLVFAPTATTTYGGGSVHVGNIMTCNPIASPPYYQGTTFTGGMYLEATQTWPNGTTGGEASWPVTWLWPMNHLLGGTAGPAFDFTEIDSFEAPYGRNFHQWTTVVGGGHAIDHVNNCGACAPMASGVTYGMLLVPSALNGGTPKLEWWRNNALDGVASPPAPYTQSVFDFAASSNFCLLIGAAHNNPMTSMTIRIWQVRR